MGRTFEPTGGKKKYEPLTSYSSSVHHTQSHFEATGRKLLTYAVIATVLGVAAYSAKPVRNAGNKIMNTLNSAFKLTPGQ